MIYLVTHGERIHGPDPGHTLDGKEQIRGLLSLLPDGVPLFVVGTGRRFMEIHQIVSEDLRFATVSVDFSPFCGSADSQHSAEETMLANGTTIRKADYLGLASGWGFNGWDFVQRFPPNTVFCAGGELMMALGHKSEKGQLYELDPQSRNIKNLSA